MLSAAPPAYDVEANVLYHKIEKLDKDLKKRELHLAELIDEVVYAEDGKDKAVRRAESARYLVNQLEGMVQNLLGYLKVIEGDILLPAFLELSCVMPQEPLKSREVIAQTLEKIVEDSLSSRTKKLIAAVREIPSETKNLATREVFMRTVAKESVSVEDAIVLSGLLLERKEELTAFMDDLRDRVQYILQGNRSESPGEGMNRSVGTIKNACFDHEELQEKLRRVENERDALRQQILSRGENTLRMNPAFQEETEALGKQFLDSRYLLSKAQSNSQAMGVRVEALEREIEEMCREKKMLQNEVQFLKRDQISRSRFYAEERRVEEGSKQLRAELDRIISEHAVIIAATESKMADLRAQNTILLTEKQEYKQHMDDKNHQIANLQRTNDLLRRELFELQQKILSSSPSSIKNEHSESVQGLESTVAGLTAELNALERRLADVSARNQEERKQIVAQYEEERSRYKAERQECDALVERMANELEKLAMENRSLRAAATLQQL
ncbi:hypothetical protein ECC02_005912 [Trypanosoma cruzi]|uniref:Uncharacterized protein n=1 Tax=Trypanosoma cruzi TaxID=5693 RepID=A0A7J6Y3R2_TRYCR|nr:hypothetical protein ECC02_005912 [Trypanosoma cruzi]